LCAYTRGFLLFTFFKAFLALPKLFYQSLVSVGVFVKVIDSRDHKRRSLRVIRTPFFVIVKISHFLADPLPERRLIVSRTS
jgi:hypothetical protein